MKVNETWSIEQDACNVILVKYGVSEAGNQTEDRSCYPTLEKACLGLVRKSVITSDLSTILATIDQSTCDIIEACKNISKEKV